MKVKLEKALKKQNRQKKKIFIVMYFLAVFLPVITYLAYIDSIFIWGFLGIIEIFIIYEILSMINNHKLEFELSNNHLRIKSGIFSSKSLIYCDKVVTVHTSKVLEDMEIILISITNTKNKRLRPVTKEFEKKYKEASDEINRLKKINASTVYYYQVIKRGALYKYILLDKIYKSCVNASYTDSAIDNIKIARGQSEI